MDKLSTVKNQIRELSALMEDALQQKKGVDTVHYLQTRLDELNQEQARLSAEQNSVPRSISE